MEVNSGLMTQEKTKEKKSMADHHDARIAMYLEEENIAKKLIAEIKNGIVGGQIRGDAEASHHGMCDSEGRHPLRSSGSGTALLQCVDTTRKGEWEDKRGGSGCKVYPTDKTKQASYTSGSVNISFILRKF